MALSDSDSALTSGLECEERAVCRIDYDVTRNAPADSFAILYYCEDCGTHQCQDCNRHIHCKIKGHNFREVPQQNGQVTGSKDPIMKQCELWCNPRNDAIYFCEECYVRLCGNCDTRLHTNSKAKRQNHTRNSLDPENFYNCNKEALSQAFLLLNEHEEIKINSPEELSKLLGDDITIQARFKVVAIFGNTGDGKSHTLNYSFFNGQEIFNVSDRQAACTIGVWAKYSPQYQTLFLDTEGLLGDTTNANKRTRMLLKVLAIADIVVYRTRAERLHSDMFRFLGDASKAYTDYFTVELQQAIERCNLSLPPSHLGPALLVFQETQHTQPLSISTYQNKHRTVQASSNDTAIVPSSSNDTAIVRPSSNYTNTATVPLSSNYTNTATVPPSSTNSDTVPPSSTISGTVPPSSTNLGTVPPSSTNSDTVPSSKNDPDTVPPSKNDPRTVSNSNNRTSPAIVSNSSENKLEQQQKLPQKQITTSTISPEEIIRIKFLHLGYFPKAFSSTNYVGIRTKSEPTNFSLFTSKIKSMLANNTVRAPRTSEVFFRALQALNIKFNGHIDSSPEPSFPDQYFTCTVRCLTCGSRCERGMNHKMDGMSHYTIHRCKYTHQFDNKVYTCMQCFEQGRDSIVIPKTGATNSSSWSALAQYVWSGYVLECSTCGVIYRSRQYWYGNLEPTDRAARTEIKHVWDGDASSGLTTQHHLGRKIIDHISGISQGIAESSQAANVTSWLTNQIRPGYWAPDFSIVACHGCRTEFAVSDTKHHCRACGLGFCSDCSNYFCPVPEHGWGTSPVRVCKSCNNIRDKSSTLIQNNSTTHLKGTSDYRANSTEDSDDDFVSVGILSDSENNDMNYAQNIPEYNVTARFMSEGFQSVAAIVSNAAEIPKSYITEFARPSYWVPDVNIHECYLCRSPFTVGQKKHHCRACGQGFCQNCSSNTRMVPNRCWEIPVRVCDDCAKQL